MTDKKIEPGDIVKKKTMRGYKYGKVLRKGCFGKNYWIVRWGEGDNVTEEGAYILEVVMKGGGK